MAQKNILVVLTSVGQYPESVEPSRPTGLWLGEAVHFVDKVQKAGYKVDYVSPQGGYISIDPESLKQGMTSPVDWQYYNDKKFMTDLVNSKKASNVDPSQYAAIYYTGGHGTVYDFPDDTDLQSLSKSIYEAGGVVSSVCHGATALFNIKLSDGSNLIKGKKVTGFSNTEEAAVGLDKKLPVLTESKLTEHGGLYEKAPNDWAPYVVVDGKLVTGQNPASAGGVADEVIKILQQ